MTLAGRLLQTSLTHFKFFKICLLQPRKMLQANKVLRLARSSKKKLSNLQYINSQLRAKRSVFYQHDLSIGHTVDLELTLPFPLGPVPWSLPTPDRISTKTDKSKLLHGLRSHIEQILDCPCSAADNFDVNAVATEHNSFSCQLQGSDGTKVLPH